MPTIKFTLEVSQKEVAFLYTTVRLNNGRVVTDTFCKPTDSHNYLMYDSAHPKKCKDSIPYSQFLRIRRICSDIKDYDKRVISLSSHFLRRGYPKEILEEAAIQGRQKYREELWNLKRAASASTDKVFLISTYHPSDNSVKEVVKNNWGLLGESPTTQFIHEKKLVCGYRRPKNLKEMLVRAGIPFRAGDEKCDPLFEEPLIERQLSLQSRTFWEEKKQKFQIFSKPQ
jgi:hypothetical protein